LASTFGALSVGPTDSETKQKDPQSDQTKLIDLMIGKYLPCFYRLALSTKEDRAFIEEIRQDWLNILDGSLAGKHHFNYSSVSDNSS
jgi:hypothetical protein